MNNNNPESWVTQNEAQAWRVRCAELAAKLDAEHKEFQVKQATEWKEWSRKALNEAQAEYAKYILS